MDIVINILLVTLAVVVIVPNIFLFVLTCAWLIDRLTSAWRTIHWR